MLPFSIKIYFSLFTGCKDWLNFPIVFNKFEAKNQLIKIETNQMPSYIKNNLEKFKEWIDHG